MPRLLHLLLACDVLGVCVGRCCLLMSGKALVFPRQHVLQHGMCWLAEDCCVSLLLCAEKAQLYSACSNPTSRAASTPCRLCSEVLHVTQLDCHDKDAVS